MVLAWTSYFIISDILITMTGNSFISGFFVRLAVFIVFTGVMLLNGQIKQIIVANTTIFLKLLLVGFLGFLTNAFAFLGFQYSSVEVGTILLKTDILIANFITIVFLKQAFTLQDFIFSIIMLVGVYLVLDIRLSDLKFNYYDILFLLSALAVTVNAFIIKSVQSKHKVNSNVISFYNNIVVMGCFLIMTFVTLGTRWFISNDIDFSLFFTFALIGGIMQCGVYIFYYTNLRNLPVWIVNITLLLIPVVTTIVGIVLFNKSISLNIIIGMCIVLFGAVGLLLKQKNIYQKI